MPGARVRADLVVLVAVATQPLVRLHVELEERVVAQQLGAPSRLVGALDSDSVAPSPQPPPGKALQPARQKKQR